jgi:hypothetical protein
MTMKLKLQLSVVMIMALASALPIFADTNARGAQIKADNTAMNVRDQGSI